MSLSKEELDRYSRQIVLSKIGLEGQRKLKKARVSIIGVGGLGCISAIQLTLMGVGYIRLIDQDVVDLTNLQRQPLYDTSSIGYSKVEVAETRLKSLNPLIEIEPLPLTVRPDTVEQAVKDVDIVVDGLDNMEPRYAINEACLRLETPYVFGGALQTYGNTSTIIPYKTACLECLYGGVEDEELPTCETFGVIPSILGIIASIQVRETLNLILGKEPTLANRLLFCNLDDTISFDIFPVKRNPYCRMCGGEEKERVFEKTRITKLCGKDSFMISTGEVKAFDMATVANKLNSKFNVKVKGQLVVTFDYNDRVSISLMKTGNMLVKGAQDEEEATDIYEGLLKVIR